MKSTPRFMLLVLLAVVGVKLSEQLYRWAAFRDERRQVGELRERLLDSGAELTLSRAEARRRREVMEAEDHKLDEERRSLMRYNRLSNGGYLPTALYGRYKAELERYNRHVVERNLRLREYQQAHDRHAAAADLYNARADSVRDLAARMGEPYYAVPTPLEAAVKRGVLKPEP
ncbi:MAG TPA: hypothetical protein VF710_22740 [Longimicrobium sp.]|jgi:thioesterase domain-containing protein